jgi:uncharacterized protein YcbK (DUF882 family)
LAGLVAVAAAAAGSARAEEPAAASATKGHAPASPSARTTPPASKSARDSASEPQTYVVASGDTLGEIALRFGLTQKELCDANHLKECDKLREGEKLRIPSTAADPAAIVRSSSAREYASYGPPPQHPGVIHLIHGTETLQIRTLDRHKRVPAATQKAIDEMLRSYRTGIRHPIDSRLIRLITDVSDHFGGRPIQVVSGFRPYASTQFTQHSNHNVGRAMDFTIPGVPNSALRDYCRTLSNVGVGYYPNSSFVHLDVRDTNAFWIDYAAAGEAPRYHRPESRDEADEGAGEVGIESETGSHSTQIDRSVNSGNQN